MSTQPIAPPVVSNSPRASPQLTGGIWGGSASDCLPPYGCPS